MRNKHKNDQKHGKTGMIGGNPRYGKKRGNFKGQRAANNAAAAIQIREAKG